MVERRLDCPFEFKLDGDEGTFSGFGSVFGVKDSFSDIVAKGAFKRTLAEAKASGNMPALLWQHIPSQPIGVWEDMAEVSRGLKVTGRLVLETQKGAEAHALLKAGALNGLSIGFNTVTSEMNDKKRIRTLTDVDLWEVSIVTFPANGKARITQVKNSPENIRDFEAFLRDEGRYSHRTAKLIASRGFIEPPGPRDEDELAELISLAKRRGVFS